jgi:hypothetical protein
MKSTHFIKQKIYKLSCLMYHSFRIPRHGMSNTINNIGLNSFHSVTSLKQQSANRYVTPLGHITLFRPNQSLILL